MVMSFQQVTKSKRKDSAFKNNNLTCNEDNEIKKSNPYSLIALQQSAGNQSLQKLTKSNKYKSTIQLSKASDQDEKEADEATDSIVSVHFNDMYAKPYKKGNKANHECTSCQNLRNYKTSSISTRNISLVNDTINSEVSNEINDVVSKSGRPLNASTETFMEKQFGYDLSNIKIHLDTKSAKKLDAYAYTIRDHIVFQNRYYNPSTKEGLRILSHELVHATKQNNNRNNSDLIVKRFNNDLDTNTEYVTDNIERYENYEENVEPYLLPNIFEQEDGNVEERRYYLPDIENPEQTVEVWTLDDVVVILALAEKQLEDDLSLLGDVTGSNATVSETYPDLDIAISEFLERVNVADVLTLEDASRSKKILNKVIRFRIAIKKSLTSHLKLKLDALLVRVNDAIKGAKRFLELGSSEILRQAFVKGEEDQFTKILEAISDAESIVSQFVTQKKLISFVLEEISKKIGIWEKVSQIEQFMKEAKFLKIFEIGKKGLSSVTKFKKIIDTIYPEGITELEQEKNRIKTVLEISSDTAQTIAEKGASGIRGGFTSLHFVGVYLDYQVKMAGLALEMAYKFLSKYKHYIKNVEMSKSIVKSRGYVKFDEFDWDAEPGGEEVGRFMVELMHARNSLFLTHGISEDVKEFFVDNKKFMNLMVSARSASESTKELPTYHVLWMEYLHEGLADRWLFKYRNRIWNMLYGEMPVPSSPKKEEK
jgi:hypothetical protein